MSNSNILYYCFIVLFFVTTGACKNDSTDVDQSSVSGETNVHVESSKSLKELEVITDTNPNSKNVSLLFDGVMKEIKKIKSSNPEKKALLKEGIRFAEKYKRPNFASGFYFSLLQDYPSDPNTKDYIFNLAVNMKNTNNISASDVLFSNFAERFSSDERSKEAIANVSSDFENMEIYLKKQGDLAFKREKGTKIDKIIVKDYVNACEAYALSNPESSLSPKYLYKGSELARSIKSLEKVISLYDWIITKYPNFEKTATVHFLKGFIIENDAHNPEAAKVIYEDFIAKYPKHELADDVKFLLKNIGKSNEEILKLLEKNKKK